MKRGRLRRNARIGQYRILEFVGQTESHSIYTALKGNTNQLFWLLQANQPLQQLASGQSEPFQLGAEYYLSFPVEGTSAAALARLVGVVAWKFIVPRWAELAEHVGQMHSRGQLFQQSSPLDLDNILLNNQARFFPLSHTTSSEGVTVFQAPEVGRGNTTPASDVFALGAALLFLLGGGSLDVAALKNRIPARKPAVPKRLEKTLAKATDRDPDRRFRDAAALAKALFATSPRVQPTRVPPRRSIRRPLFLALVGVALVCVIAVLILLFPQGPAAMSSLLSALTPGPTAVPTALPSGELALNVLSVDVTPDRVGHIEVKFTRGEKSLGQEVTAEFVVTLDGDAIPQISVHKYIVGTGEGPEYRYRLSFDTSGFATATGTYRITARMIRFNVSASFDFEKPPVNR